jgi:hypothetical protein
MVQTYAVFSHGQFIWMLQVNVTMVLFDPGFIGKADLLSADLTTFTGNAAYTWNFESWVFLHGPKGSWGYSSGEDQQTCCYV